MPIPIRSRTVRSANSVVTATNAGRPTMTETGAPVFQSWGAADREGEKAAFEAFIDFVHARLKGLPDLHVYHYASYEVTAMKRLMSEHATREEEVDQLLRREVFVDLYQ